ncbi:MAG TPA: hypothetical protein VEY95_05365 [Azospirillaceae bacterium]|nr:hypothetical protein [Azospirillaceae bacterium]
MGTPKTLTGLLLAAAALATSGATAGMAAAQSAVMNAETGTLRLDVTLTGAATHKGPDGKSHENIKVNRKLRLEFPMRNEGPMNGDWARDVMDPDIGASAGGLPQGYDQIIKAMSACGDDDECRMRVGLQMGEKMQAGQIAKPQAPNMGNANRYINWKVDSGRGACATGTVSVADQGSGVSMGEAEGSFNYSYTLKGEVNFPSKDEQATATICGAFLTVDTTTKKYSLRFDVLTVPVKVAYEGKTWSRTSQGRTTKLLDQAKAGGKYGSSIALFDMPLPAQGKVLEGNRRFDAIGGVVFYDPAARRMAPVNAEVAWHFSAK